MLSNLTLAMDDLARTIYSITLTDICNCYLSK